MIIAQATSVGVLAVVLPASPTFITARFIVRRRKSVRHMDLICTFPELDEETCEKNQDEDDDDEEDRERRVLFSIWKTFFAQLIIKRPIFLISFYLKRTGSYF